MNISVFGLGYVGSVTAACLAGRGHRVIGVDIERAKVDAVAAGGSSVLEPGLADLIAREVRGGRLAATTRAAEPGIAPVSRRLGQGQRAVRPGGRRVSETRRGEHADRARREIG